MQDSPPSSEDLFAPSVILSVSPSRLADPADNGAGPFRSHHERDVRLAAVSETSPTLEVCIANDLFPADGAPMPVCSSKCFASDTASIMVLGGELIMSGGGLAMVPETGKKASLCAVRAQAYDDRSRNDACQAADCFRRGFSLSHGGSPIITCAVHLQGRLAEMPRKSTVVADEPVPAPPEAIRHPERTSVTWKQEKYYRFPDDEIDTKKKKKTAEIASPSSTSESWGSREQEIQNLFGTKKPRRKSTQSVREGLSSQNPSESEPSKKRKKERSARSLSSDTSIESRVQLFRRSLSKRSSQRSAHRSSSNGSEVGHGRREGRPTSRESSQPGSEEVSDQVPHHTVHSGPRVRLPAFLRQPIPRGTAAPVVIRAGPKLHKRKKRGWECIADALSANHVLKEGGKRSHFS